MEQSLRRFNILDAMVLVAATAPCLSINIEKLLHRAGTLNHRLTNFEVRTYGLWFCYVLFGFWSVGLLILRLRSPRPSWRRLARQPGFAALASAVLGVYGAGYVLACFAINSAVASRIAPCIAGAAVGGAWLLLITTRQWQTEPSWIDRTARAIGIGWIALGMANYLNIVSH